MIRRLLIIVAATICVTTVTAHEVAAIFGKADYPGPVADQIMFSEIACDRTYDIEGICSLHVTNLHPKYSTYVNNKHLHWYKADRMTVTPETGVTISAITFQCTEPDYCDKLTISNGSVIPDKTTSIVRWTGQAATPLSLAADASQLRVSYAVIEYSAAQSAAGSIHADVTDCDDTPTEYFTLQGVRIINPSHGIYICRKGSKVSKIYIR